jgi:transcriptional regulator with XRE-family HTH domain
VNVRPSRADQQHKRRVDAIDIEIGGRIRARRLTKGMSQTALAKGLGVTFQQVQKYENGTNRVSAGRLRRIAEVLEVPTAFFFPNAEQETVDAHPLLTSAAQFLDTARAVRLVKAFAKLKSTQVQTAIVELVERLAAQRGN